MDYALEHCQVNTLLHIFLPDSVVVAAAKSDIGENRLIEENAPLLNKSDVVSDPVDTQFLYWDAIDENSARDWRV